MGGGLQVMKKLFRATSYLLFLLPSLGPIAMDFYGRPATLSERAIMGGLTAIFLFLASSDKEL
jgi:hypothetical protein